MKKILLSATFALASFGAFASNSNEIALKSNNLPVKNYIEVVASDKVVSAIADIKEQPITCTVTVSAVFVEFSVSWCCANCA